MTWFRVDDSFYDHPKAEELPDSAVALWTRGGSWCSKHLTDGRIPYRKARKLCDNPDEAIPALIKSGLWEDIPGADAAQYHDWTDPWNPSRAAIMAEREANAARQKAWRERKAAEREAATNTARNNPRNAVTNDAPTPPDPTPPHRPTGEDLPLFPHPQDGEKPKPPRPRQLPLDHRFDEFWEVYPHKRDKDQARKTWGRLVRASQDPKTEISLDKVIAGARNYHLSEEFQRGHPKYPSTFLNAGTWRDYWQGPPPPAHPGTSLVALPGGRAPQGQPRGFDAKADRFRALHEQLRQQTGGN